MKVSLKEAYGHARKALPAYNVQVQVSMGQTYSRSESEKIEWNVSARKTEDATKSFYAGDEIFAVALADIVTQIKGEEMNPADDVDVAQGDEKEEGTEDKTEAKINPKEAIKSEEIPF